MLHVLRGMAGRETNSQARRTVGNRRRANSRNEQAVVFQCAGQTHGAAGVTDDQRHDLTARLSARETEFLKSATQLLCQREHSAPAFRFGSHDLDGTAGSSSDGRSKGR